jgi:CubicO group peptidase (beta-lactamase class C family)
MRWIAITLLSTLAWTASAAAPHRAPASRLAASVDSLGADTSFAGVVLVARHGVPVVRRAFGDACIEWSQRNVPDGIFPIGSISKQLTALGILALEQDGRLSVRDTIARYFPEAPASWRRITIHQLLTHTSGIPDLVRLPEFGELIRHTVALDSLVRLLASKPLDFEPGSRFLYGNSGYTLAAALIERLTHRPYAEFIAQRICRPAGMRSTGAWDGRTLVRHMAHGYARRNGVLRLPEALDWSIPLGAGTCYSSADDLLLLDRALHAGRIVPAEAVGRVLSPYEFGYGYGWYVSGSGGPRIHEHMGDINGFGAYVTHDLDADVLVIVLSNVQGTPVQSIARSLLLAEQIDLRLAR